MRIAFSNVLEYVRKLKTRKHTMKKTISMMGSEGCGKTCFLAGLAWLGTAGTQSDFCVVGEGNSQKYLNELLSALKNGELPNATHAPSDLAFDVIHRSARYGFGMQDFPGEEFKKQGFELDPSTSPLYEHIRNSDILLVVLDPGDVDRSETVDYKRLDAVLHILAREEIATSEKQIAIILSKADLYDHFKGGMGTVNPREFLKEKNPELFQKFETLKLVPEYFFVSSLGSDMKSGQKPDPKGYESIFQWMALAERNRQIVGSASKVFQNRWFRIALVLGVLTLAGFLCRNAINDKKGQVITGGGVSEDDKGRKTSELPNGDQKDKIVYAQIQQYQNRLSAADSFDSCRELFENINKYKNDVNPTSQQDGQLCELKRKTAAKATDQLFWSAQSQFKQQNYPDCMKTIDKFHRQNWLPQDHSGFKDLSTQLERTLMEDAKQRIARLPSGTASQISTKCKAVEDYQWFLDNEKKDARQAVAVTRRLLESDREYSIRVTKVGRLESIHRTYLEFQVGNRSYTTEKVEAQEPLWPDGIGTFKWKKEEPIHVYWYWKSKAGLYPVLIAKLQIQKGLTSLLELLSSPGLEECTGVQVPSVEGVPSLKIECDDFPQAEKDLELVRKYICPGSYWGGL